ncbi:MAG: YggT family protein [Micrococcales bacterium]
MGIVFLTLDWALRLLSYAMIGRLIFELIRSANPAWSPKGLVIVVAEVCYTATDWLVNSIRRFIPTVRVGMLGLDFGWTIGMVLIFVAQNLLRVLAAIL